MRRKLKGEIFRKPGDVSMNGLVEAGCRHAIEPGQVGVENDALAAEGENGQ